ncbi:c-type cytochrome biogenesis protein CcsB [Streptomyces albogriseolus]|uniref:c-type cytochrome biogenesis protein CcsB n=1 Tax=Streptomyces albogriseolus TaxID=1887 RepID=UPI0019AD1682|nr:c-type cytochrome biogenesis protein CcsB [Streptomyces viridodiastaticus]MCX4570642.1 c-type cytochrome biogenesis protein CcsB [Streptomyces viridodiastaticus]GHG02204.1 c-type cytochrome biogenesis protein CcsB [Streptomyces viridodiastaticus]
MSGTSLADQNLAQLANWLMYSAIAVYLLAFVAACAEWAFGGSTKVVRVSAAASSAQQTPVTPSRGRTRSVAVDGATGSSTQVLASPAATSPEEHRTPAGDGPGAAGDSPRADMVGRIAVSLTVLALLLHLGSVLARGLAVSRPPWGNMYEFSTAFALMASVAYVGLLAARKPVRWLGVPVLFSVLLTLGLAVSVLYVDSAQLVPALHSYWLWIHVSAAIISGGVFHTAAVVSVLYLFRDRWEREVAAGRGDGRTAELWRRLPSARTLDKLAYRLTGLVFPLWTFAVIAGAVWAEAAWGRYWGWDPKETWAFITWVAYAAYLHARATAGWKGRRAAVLGLVAFATFVFNYYGVNILITGLHSYGGLPTG